MARFWLTVFPRARSLLHRWERAARAIPDPRLRTLALETLRSEGLSAMGAALVATTVRQRDPALVRLLVSLQVAWDYIDTLAEQPATDPLANGMQLHRALVDAVRPEPPRNDYYRLHPVGDDGGYLLALVECCRAACASLPAFERVAHAAARELEHAEVQYANHAPRGRREAVLREWAARQHEHSDASWFELAAAASSSLGVLAILALAADPTTSDTTVERLQSAYVPWVDALTALLDSVVDRPADAHAGLTSWVDHYPSDDATTARLQTVTARAVEGVRTLPRGERHVVIVTGMMAMHLSQPSAQLPGVQPTTRAVLRTAETFAMPVLLLLLRGWRRARAQQGGAGARMLGAGRPGDDLELRGARCQPAVSPTGQLTPVPPSPQ
ncbi:MAG TPA: DUF2600 family protein [Conexibacter sp.]|jgi:tetraprenyl-beta-curcumene synthase|nr:DUF2600 family protein [Conexibacter sp.]